MTLAILATIAALLFWAKAMVSWNGEHLLASYGATIVAVTLWAVYFWERLS
jgi:hypothetical protein